MKPTFVQTNTFDTISFIAEIYDSQDFANLAPIKQAYALAFDENDKLLLVYNKGGYCMLPGGSTEPGENPIETLTRELMEEAAVTVHPESIHPAFYQYVTRIENGEKKPRGYELRYFCRISEKLPFEGDPCEGRIVRQHYCDNTELDKYLLWGDTTLFIQKLCKRYLDLK